MAYAAVEGHLDGDYVTEVNDDHDIEMIEERCPKCGDSDWVIGVFDTKAEAYKALGKEQ